MTNDDKKATVPVSEEKIEAPEPNMEKQDANVNEEGLCTMTQDGEMARPNSGEPCDDGR